MAYIILTDEMGARLENEILVRGWSLRDFAKKSGVSVSAISRYINGEVKKVNARTIYKFATTLGTTVDWLRWGAQQNRKNDLISRSALKELKLAIPFKEIGGRRNEKFKEIIVANYQKGWNDCIDNIIDNAPTVELTETEVQEVLNKRCMTAVANEYLIALHGKNERPKEGEIIKCKDCKHRKSYWHKDKRMKEKGYWIYGCELISDSFVGTPVWGEDNQFCSSAERVDI